MPCSLRLCWGCGRAPQPPSGNWNRPARPAVSLAPALGERAARAALSRALCVPQALRDQVRRVPAGHPAHAGGAPRPGLRVPPALLRLRGVQTAAGHGRRVLPHGGQPAGVQGGLRGGQAARSVGGAGPGPGPGAPYSSANGVKASRWGAQGPRPPAPAAASSLSAPIRVPSLRPGSEGTYPGPGGAGRRPSGEAGLDSQQPPRRERSGAGLTANYHPSSDLSS